MPAYCRRVASGAIYRHHADAYARICEHSLPNAAYDRPAILRLADLGTQPIPGAIRDVPVAARRVILRPPT